uniref:hypothetical protein n=1 Tax=Paraburkholderia terrae TaxID=311230 RepID=UPI00296B0FAF
MRLIVTGCGRWETPRFRFIRSIQRGGFFAIALAFAIWPSWRGWFGFMGFSLASAICYLASSVAPVRGGTYFSLPPRNYSAVTRGETTNPAKPNASASISE